MQVRDDMKDEGVGCQRESEYSKMINVGKQSWVKDQFNVKRSRSFLQTI
jgi:hypothetical protein